MKYLSQYPDYIIQRVKELISNQTLNIYLQAKYKNNHEIKNDKLLYQYVMAIKNESFNNSAPLSKIIFDSKIHDLSSALGTHTFVLRIQGGKLKRKNEIRISNIFKTLPEPFLKMIVSHELAHLKEKEHNKSFYKLCEFIEPNYHQLELDFRIYLTYLDHFGKLY